MHRSLRSCLRSFLLAITMASPLATPFAAPLAAQPADTAKKITHEPLFTSRDAWVAGGFVVGTALMFPLDRYAARKLQDSTVQANRVFHHAATDVRLVTENSLYIGAGLYLVGKVARQREIADLGLHGTEAIVVGTVLVDIGKFAAGRRRPYVNVETPRQFKLFGGGKSSNQSFPSGHTVMAFSAASAVTAEVVRHWPNGVAPWLVGIPMYGGATAMGLSRMYNNKHWASDVAMGAAIGTFSGLKVVKYHHSHPSNRIDRWLLGMGPMVMPNGDVGLAVTVGGP